MDVRVLRISGCAMKLMGQGQYNAEDRIQQEYALCYPLKHGPWFENEGGQSDATEVRAGPQLGDDVAENYSGRSVSAPDRTDLGVGG
jgi:hypothetical protein